MEASASLLHINPKTVAKKLEFLGMMCRQKLAKEMATYQAVSSIQFDELQTIEHTKCKPLSVAVAVSKEDRKVLGLQVSVMPATGHLSRI